MFQFVKSRGSDFKLIFNKLKIGKRTTSIMLVTVGWSVGPDEAKRNREEVLVNRAGRDDDISPI